jgi:AraC-like DNA-binding protein
MHATPPSPLVEGSSRLTAIYVPPYCAPPAAFLGEGPAVLVGAGGYPLVRVVPEMDGQAASFDRIVLLVHGARRAVCNRETFDPYLFRMAQSVRSGFRHDVPPPGAFLESLAGPLAAHLESFYAPRRTRARERGGLSEARLARVLALIEARLDHALCLEDLSQAAHLSPFHFNRMFKRSTGVPPHAFITRRRIAAAAELLASTTLPLSEVGRRCGYPSQPHFSTAFTRVAGMTPSSYRSQARRGEAVPDFRTPAVDRRLV